MAIGHKLYHTTCMRNFARTSLNFVGTSWKARSVYLLDGESDEPEGFTVNHLSANHLAPFGFVLRMPTEFINCVRLQVNFAWEGAFLPASKLTEFNSQESCRPIAN